MVSTHEKLCENLREHLKNNIRVQIDRSVMAVETFCKISSTQKRAIRKLYREHRCYDFIGSINNRVLTDIKEV